MWLKEGVYDHAADTSRSSALIILARKVLHDRCRTFDMITFNLNRRRGWAPGYAVAAGGRQLGGQRNCPDPVGGQLAIAREWAFSLLRPASCYWQCQDGSWWPYLRRRSAPFLSATPCSLLRPLQMLACQRSSLIHQAQGCAYLIISTPPLPPADTSM